MKLLVLILGLTMVGCSPRTVENIPLSMGEGRMKLISAQSYRYPGGYTDGVYMFRDSLTGNEYVAFFRTGGVSVQVNTGKTHDEDN